MVVSHTDITARKLAEETLKQSNELLEDRVTERTEDLQLAYAALASKEEEIRSVVENMVDCIISIDETGHHPVRQPCYRNRARLSRGRSHRPQCVHADA